MMPSVFTSPTNLQLLKEEEEAEAEEEEDVEAEEAAMKEEAEAEAEVEELMPRPQQIPTTATNHPPHHLHTPMQPT